MSQSSQFKAMEDYFQSLLNESAPVPNQPVTAAAEMQSVPVAKPTLEKPRQAELEQLLAKVPAPKAVVSAPTAVVKPVVAKSPPSPPPVVWQNIQTEREFQALFFSVAGITFGVPLTELGGIHQLGKLNSLFGKPDWFAGVMTQRDRQLNVVDTGRWIMPDKEATTDYQYLIMLGESTWGLACHELMGTEWLNRDQIKWRDKAAKRPWLAGMVKDKMCALLHVRELLTLLKQGVNIDGV
ncbi:chemotaxis protein CheW [Pseudaeromonas paramecii]|uniref:CheW-like domain-containing protein n=1 Tax=Pseudaeromonas paramecii TaxID=2138166 RepID=A0ABP8Q3Y9_9GAMM